MSLLLHLFFSFFYSILVVLSQKLWSLFYFFFIISCSLIKLSSLRSFSSALISQALISLQSQSHRRHQPQSQPSSSLSQHRAVSSSKASYFFFIISSSHLSASPSPSQPLPSLSPAHARHQPTSGQCSLFFSSEFFNCCFGLIFLDLVLFCGEKWCCPYVILGKI